MKRLILFFLLIASVAVAGELRTGGAAAGAPAAHAASHSLGGSDAITVTNLASGCTDVQVLGGTAAGTGVECQTDDDVPEGADLTAASKTRAFTIESPGAAENIIAFITDKAITVTQVSSVCLGTTPSVTWQFAHGTDLTTAADLFTADKTTTSVTTIEVDNSTFNDATIAANEAVLFQTAAASGTILNCNFTIFYTVD